MSSANKLGTMVVGSPSVGRIALGVSEVTPALASDGVSPQKQRWIALNLFVLRYCERDSGLMGLVFGETPLMQSGSKKHVPQDFLKCHRN